MARGIPSLSRLARHAIAPQLVDSVFLGRRRSHASFSPSPFTFLSDRFSEKSATISFSAVASHDADPSPCQKLPHTSYRRQAMSIGPEEVLRLPTYIEAAMPGLAEL